MQRVLPSFEQHAIPSLSARWKRREREQVLRLSRRDSETLLELLENPPEPTAEFKAAMAHYRKVKKNDADSSFDWRP